MSSLKSAGGHMFMQQNKQEMKEWKKSHNKQNIGITNKFSFMETMVTIVDIYFLVIFRGSE